MSGIAAGLIASGVGLYQAKAAASERVQIISESGDTIMIFDAVPTESMQFSSDVTDKPVEDGSVVSDHVIKKPFQNSFVGVITDTPINDLTSLAQEAVTAALSSLAPPLGVVTAAAAYAVYTANADEIKPTLAAYQSLLLLKNGDETKNPPTPPPLFSMINAQGQFDNLVMTDLSIAKSPDNDGTLVFAITVRQVTIVKAQTVNVQTLSQPGLSSGKTQAGEQPKNNMSDIEQAGVTGRFKGLSNVGEVAPEDIGGISG